MTTQPVHNVRESIPMMAPAPIVPAIIEQTARTIFEGFSEKLKATLNGRDQRALKLALEGHVTHKSDRIFSVRSEDGQHAYLVNLDKSFCNCPDSQKGYVCKHRLAAYLIEQSMKAEQQNQKQPETDPQTDGSDEAPNGYPHMPEYHEEPIDRVKKMLHARSEYMREAIIYAKLPMEKEMLPVEIIDITDNMAWVRALPYVVNGNLVARFPFPEHKSFAQVLAKSLVDVKIYR